MRQVSAFQGTHVHVWRQQSLQPRGRHCTPGRSLSLQTLCACRPCTVEMRPCSISLWPSSRAPSWTRAPRSRCCGAQVRGMLACRVGARAMYCFSCTAAVHTVAGWRHMHGTRFLFRGFAYLSSHGFAWLPGWPAHPNLPAPFTPLRRRRHRCVPAPARLHHCLLRPAARPPCIPRPGACAVAAVPGAHSARTRRSQGLAACSGGAVSFVCAEEGL